MLGLASRTHEGIDPRRRDRSGKGLGSKGILLEETIKVTIRAPDQHVRFIERRGALLRASLHKIDTHL